ncbi:MAG: YadA C-terminal domain-containing protein, partial [Myxococcales bacterium]
IALETLRAGNAETVNADAIAAETVRAGNAEIVNADAIALETLRAGNAEIVNADAIAAETVRAGNAETVNADAIAAEATIRSNADAAHTMDIVDETAARVVADAVHTNEIAFNAVGIDAVTAAAVDNANSIAGNTAALISEETNRFAADTALASDIAAEAAVRGAADAAHGSDIADNAVGIASNVSAIGDEATARVATDATHTSGIANNAAGVESNSADIAVNALSIQDNETALDMVTSAVTVTSGVTSLRAVDAKADGAQVSVGANSAMMGATTTDGENMVVVDKSSARVVFRSNAGNEHGLVVSADSTTLTGGGDEATTTIRMDADGVTFERSEASEGRSLKDGSTGEHVQLHGIAAGKAENDAVNVGQLNAIEDQLGTIEDDAYRGIAIANAMEVFLPDPGKNFRLNLGMGYYKDQAALGLTGSGRLTEDIGLYIGAGSDSSFKEVGGKAGVSFQW